LEKIKKPLLVREFYEKVLDQYFMWEATVKKQKADNLPDILSKEEIENLLGLITKPSHYLMLALSYGAGLKVSELVGIQV
jgi:site-specific recombinase XerD